MSVLGAIIKLKNQVVTVIECEMCKELMVNIDEKELAPGDLKILKQVNVKISNPETDDAICIDCEINREDNEHTFKRKVNNYFKRESNDDDSSFFGGGGFGGFGGGVFSGGGATGSF